MSDYKSMQKRMETQGASVAQAALQVIAEKDRYIAALEKRIQGLRWLVANGERVFGSLWREASQADVQLMMEKEHEHKSI